MSQCRTRGFTTSLNVIDKHDAELDRIKQEENREIYCAVVHLLPADRVLTELKDQLQVGLVEMEKAKRLLERYGDSSARSRFRRIARKIDMLRYRIKQTEKVAC